ncbi:alpha-xenorhabdolysin family binary toxin subunit A [Pseudomonas sp.]|uniref:alpha-xenorhabdolysin family binary toxin subunit A n=1 Tax=Pseudomonas sp. TaxID=306 RepID=UPI0026066415|nr:alpha-xenorhabdolysin family binary toxin subunit A [Pseudomonas sp.]
MTNIVTDNNVIDTAAGAYDAYIKASLGKDPESTRAKGIVLTKDEIISIRKYVYAALKLPDSIVDVKAYLGYNGGAGIGNEPIDFQRSFFIIKTHAESWDPLYRDIRNVTTELKLFGANMVIYGDQMKTVLSQIKGDKTLKALGIETYEDLAAVKLKMGNAFPGIELDENDLETAASFGDHIDIMLKGVTAQSNSAQGINDKLSSFANDLANKVQSQINTRLSAIDTSSLPQEITALNTKVEERAVSIDEKTKEYKSAVEKSIGSAAGLNPFGLAMAIYIGVEAEKIRKERNALKNLQEIDIALLKEKNSILGRLALVKLDMQNLNMLVINADHATKNLVAVWDSITTYTKYSKDAAADITDAMKARMFVTHFSLVVAPWKLMSNDVADLLQVFIEADNEFNNLPTSN